MCHFWSLHGKSIGRKTAVHVCRDGRRQVGSGGEIRQAEIRGPGGNKESDNAGRHGGEELDETNMVLEMSMQLRVQGAAFLLFPLHSLGWSEKKFKVIFPFRVTSAISLWDQ